MYVMQLLPDAIKARVMLKALRHYENTVILTEEEYDALVAVITEMAGKMHVARRQGKL